MSDWHWEPHPDDLLDDLPLEARAELELLAREITVRDSMVYPDGRDYEGPGPGLRTETRGTLAGDAGVQAHVGALKALTCRRD